MRQLRLSERAELVVDNFAGGGGASIGIEEALGRPIEKLLDIIAIRKWVGFELAWLDKPEYQQQRGGPRAGQVTAAVADLEAAKHA